MSTQYSRIPIPVSITGPITISDPITVNQGTNPWTVAGSVSISNFPATQSVTQGTSPWVVSGTVTANIGTTGGLALDSSLTTINTTLGSPFQAGGSIGNTSFGASQTGVWSVGRTWTLSSGTDSVNVGNFPSSFSVTQGTSPWLTSRNWNLSFANDKADVSGSSVSVSNFPATVAVTQSTSPWVVSGTVTANQGTSPWVVSGTVTANAGTGTFLVDGSAHTQPVSGTVTANAGTGTFTVAGTVTANAGTGTFLVDGSAHTQPISGTVAATQSGAWTTGRTWNLSSGGDSVAATQSGSWTVTSNQGTPNTAANGWPTKITDGTNTASVSSGGGLIVAGLTAVGVAPINNPVSVSGVDGGGLKRALLTDTSGATVIVGSAASGASDTGNPVKIGSVANTTLPTVTAGQRVDAQSDLNGRIYVNAVPVDGAKATYMASSSTPFSPAATPTDVFTITGSATKTVKVLRVFFTATQTNGGTINLFVLKRSTANTGGTSTAVTAVPLDSNDSAATATVLQYTANPTTGTLVGNLYSLKMQVPSANLNSGNNAWQGINFDQTPSKALVLRGTSQVLAINLGGTTLTGGSILCTVLWTEE